MGPLQNPFSAFTASRGPTVKTIQGLLQRIGAATSGTKDVLQSRLFKEIAQYKVPEFTRARTGGLLKGPRILSIDMGIKNLAFCVTDVYRSALTGKASMEVVSWRRLDLTDEALKTNVKRNIAEDVVTEAWGKEADPFAPEFLSQTAYWLLRKNLLDYRPDVILIERQRWRSSSSSAIQQWTVRVNSLEAMLWAILATLQGEYKLLPQEQRRKHKKPMSVFAVDPKRVGTYWLDDDTRTPPPASSKKKVIKEDELEDEERGREVPLLGASSGPTKKVSRGKAEKKAKIQLLRTWLHAEKPSSMLSIRGNTSEIEFTHRPTINFSFRNELGDPRADAETTRQTVLYATDPISERSQRTQIRVDDVKKVDDLTDCLLQAAAWVAWEENRAILRTQFNQFRADLEEELGRELRTIDAGFLRDGAVKELRESGGTKKQQEIAEEKASKTSTKGTKGQKQAVVKKTSRTGMKGRKKAA